ncbi:hypothetical protein M3Y98_00418000 [Aphelenchoides besseyi]|nr:hypothetical protein M3Y98_00418000 [Aphelenchoides besseyi]KAI6202106.1 hypothetical protein M3Y96_00913200 [Aphelenchoides besseyi]
MRTFVLISAVVCVASAFSLLREFDDERLLPNVRFNRAADESAEIVATGSGAEPTIVVEGSGERKTRDTEAIEIEASGQSTDEKVRRRRSEDIPVVGSDGSGEGSGEEVTTASAARFRRALESTVVEGSGVEGSGEA